MGNAECSSHIQIVQRMVDGLPPSDLKTSSCPGPAASTSLAVAISAGLQDLVQSRNKVSTTSMLACGCIVNRL